MKEELGDAIDRIETGIRQALNDERVFSQKNGFEKGHYWLHRKIDQVLDEVREHYELDNWTPHLTNDNDYLRGMAEAYQHIIEDHPELEKEIRERAWDLLDAVKPRTDRRI